MSLGSPCKAVCFSGKEEGKVDSTGKNEPKEEHQTDSVEEQCVEEMQTDAEEEVNVDRKDAGQCKTVTEQEDSARENGDGAHEEEHKAAAVDEKSEEKQQVEHVEDLVKECKKDEDGSDWTLVERRTRKKSKAVRCEVKEVKGKGKQLERKEQKKALPLYKEDKVSVVVEVAPNMRRHVIGPRGDTLQALQREYCGVRVSVPPPSDLHTKGITLAGPRSIVAAAAQNIKSHIQAIEAQLQKEQQARQQGQKKVTVAVTPNQRRHIVGWGGEAIRRLQEEHPGVCVMVPPTRDTRTETVTLKGPCDQVEAAARCLTARLEAKKARRSSAKKLPSKASPQ